VYLPAVGELRGCLTDGWGDRCDASGAGFLRSAHEICNPSHPISNGCVQQLQFVLSQQRDATSNPLEPPMNATLSILTRTESTMAAACATALSIVSLGAVLALFGSVTPDATPINHTVFDTVVITASRSA
jgi:hypothetical protein